MIIKRLTMKDFGVYAGINSFIFSHNRPVVLIGGMNGRGKTTFLEAILISLYGANSASFKESSYRSYGQYLRAHVNKDSSEQSCYIELSFVLDQRSQEEYQIRREWDACGKRTAEKISVMKNGEESEFLTRNWAVFIENILPSALSSFFFFDGEKIAELAVDNGNTQIKDSIRAMLGISVLDVLKSDLGRILKKSSKKIQNSDMSQVLQGLRDQVTRLEHQVDVSADHITSLDTKIQKKQELIDSLHQQYVVQGGDIAQQRSELQAKKADIQSKIDQNISILQDLAADVLPLTLVRDLILEIKLQGEDEHDAFIMEQALVQMEELLSAYSATHPDALPVNRAFLDYVKVEAAGESITPVYNLSDQALFQLNSLLESLLDSEKERAVFCLQEKMNLQRKLDELESYLSLDIHSETLSKLQSQIKHAEKQLLEYQVKLSAAQEAHHQLVSALAAKTSELNKAVEGYLAEEEMTDDSARMIKYTNIALQITDAYTVELQKRKTGLLGNTITACYHQLANKKNMICQIMMDPVTLDLQYLDKTGVEVSKDSLSAGEKQLMVIAILWALALCSKKKLPVIIDTPLSRLDSMHRTSLVKTYFPQASEQTIILSTDSEIDRTYYDMMRDSVGDEFTLHYDEATRSTTILKGYFQEK